MCGCRSILEVRGNPARPDTVHDVLSAVRATATVLWMDAGHEVLQECKKVMTTLFRQLASDEHDDRPSGLPPPGGGVPAGQGKGKGKAGVGHGAEDRYIAAVLQHVDSPAKGRRAGKGARKQQLQQQQQQQQRAEATKQTSEWMQWRKKRDSKRLARMDSHAIVIQRAYRAYLTRRFGTDVRRQLAAVNVQRWWRGVRARMWRRMKSRELQAAALIQRVWRGSCGRQIASEMMLQRRSAMLIQRSYRGYIARAWVTLLREARHAAAICIQVGRLCLRSGLRSAQ